MRSERKQVKQLGKGSFACVYLQMNEKMCYACKKILLPLSYPITFIIDQVNSLKCLNHPNLVKYLGFSFNSFKSFDIFLQYVNGKMLDKAYKDIRNEETLFYWIFQLCKGLQYLKQKGIVHRDLKPKNILVDQKGIIKIVDFGISKIMYNHHSEIAGTLHYIAPQIISKKTVCYQSDIWSLGIIVYQLSHQKQPFILEDRKQLTKQKLINSINSIKISETVCSKEMSTLLKGMLQVDPQLRMTARDILHHNIIKSRQQVFSKLYNEALSQFLK